jgi:hypothetical protein
MKESYCFGLRCIRPDDQNQHYEISVTDLLRYECVYNQLIMLVMLVLVTNFILDPDTGERILKNV